jgi:hypothetical protein
VVVVEVVVVVVVLVDVDVVVDPVVVEDEVGVPPPVPTVEVATVLPQATSSARGRPAAPRTTRFIRSS